MSADSKDYKIGYNKGLEAAVRVLEGYDVPLPLAVWTGPKKALLQALTTKQVKFIRELKLTEEEVRRNAPDKDPWDDPCRTCGRPYWTCEH